MPWKPEFGSDLAQNLMQPFPHPNVTLDKISLILAHWLRRYLSLKMFTHRQTDTQSDTQTMARLVYYELTSGELIIYSPYSLFKSIMKKQKTGKSVKTHPVDVKVCLKGWVRASSPEENLSLSCVEKTNQRNSQKCIHFENNTLKAIGCNSVLFHKKLLMEKVVSLCLYTLSTS